MKYGIIDVGSNSVRLMISENGVMLGKEIKTTRLAEKTNDSGEIDFSAAKNTVEAFCFFVRKAKERGVDKVYAFATAAVRRAKNGVAFAKLLENETGVPVEIVSGELEAEIGIKGALNGKDGGVIDIGGASTEIAVVKNGVKIYGKSVPTGAVTLTTACGSDELRAKSVVCEKIKEFGVVPDCEFYCIGGTATSLASVSLGLKTYDPRKIQGYRLEKSALFNLKDKLYGLSLEEKKRLSGLQPERADIIQSGAAILCAIAEYVGASGFIVSESDNLEGYLALKTENL